MSGAVKRKPIMRMLTEDRVVRALQRGGMCLLSGGRWHVYRTQDKRGTCIGLALTNLVERLEAQGDVRAEGRQSGRRIWCGAPLDMPRIALAPVPESLRPRSKIVGATSALDAALKYESDDDARIRLLAAVRRYLADWEQAATPHSMTMQWGQSRVDGGRDVTRYGGPGGRSQAAGARLTATRAALGRGDTRLVDELIIEGVSCRTFERRLGVGRSEAQGAGHGALTALATAYDLQVKAV